METVVEIDLVLQVVNIKSFVVSSQTNLKSDRMMLC